MPRTFLLNIFAFILAFPLTSQSLVTGTINYGDPLQDWDGFGVNYVETAQTTDYDHWKQDYGGFSLLSEEQRQEILPMIFGTDGLKPGLLKMFLDPFHEPQNDNTEPNIMNPGGFNHARTTEWMRYFAREGLKITRERKADLSIITTLYGPPAWMTKQKVVRGRDLDPALKDELVEYLIAWVKYLRQEEKLPVNYLSLHNEGEARYRWLEDGTTEPGTGHDYNLWWPPQQVADFLSFMRSRLDKQGLQDVGLAPGETTQWARFLDGGYMEAIVLNRAAMDNIGLITSHGFASGPKFMDQLKGKTFNTLREKRPDLHLWTTSTSWYNMDADFVFYLYHQIYTVKANGVIPWAVIQTSDWKGGDPNPGTAFRVKGEKQYTVEPGYYYYKQVSRAGQPGMKVARVSCSHPEVYLIAFGHNWSGNPNAFVVINRTEESQDMDLEVLASFEKTYEGFRTSATEQYQHLSRIPIENNRVKFTVPPRSVTTWFEVK